MITAGLVALLVGIFIYQVTYGYSANIAFSKGHTSAYEHGYNAALNNDTLTTACPSTANYDNCSSGFYNGHQKLEMTTRAYAVGFGQAKKDSILGLYDTDDACGKYNQDYAHTSCQNGYSAGYDNKLKWTDNTIVQKYRDSTAYQLGFDAGAKNGNETEACMTFSNRDLATCRHAYYYGQDPRYNQPSHCSTNDNEATSCYNLGHDAGYASAEKEIVRCHEVSVPPLLSGHSPQFTRGWIDGWTEANTKAENHNGTYGNGCTKYY
jgi:hypothetical protein